MKMRINCFVLLICIPFIAQAQTHKCKKPDGSVIFQDRPCPAGTASSALSLPPVSDEPANTPGNPKGITWQAKAGPSSLQDNGGDNQRRREAEESKARDAKIEAYNRSVRCNQARQQLGVAKEERPIYSYDNKGERQYVEDENRPALIAAAEQRVAEACK